MKDSFNADFYAAAATVIPVLYLAIAVQGSTFDATLRWLYGVVARRKGIAARYTAGSRLAWLRKISGNREMRIARFAITLLASTIVLFMAIALIGSLVGEAIAVLALYHRQSSSWQVLCVISVIFLAAVIALIPFWRLAATFLRLLSMGARDRRDRRRAYEVSSETDEVPLTIADYRSHFSQQKTREEAERFAEVVLADRSPSAERRLGGPTEDDIRRALDEAFPLSDGFGDIARLREIAEKWVRAHADELDETARREFQKREEEASVKNRWRGVGPDDDDSRKDP
jgi:hypothetical protein